MPWQCIGAAKGRLVEAEVPLDLDETAAFEHEQASQDSSQASTGEMLAFVAKQ